MRNMSVGTPFMGPITASFVNTTRAVERENFCEHEARDQRRQRETRNGLDDDDRVGGGVTQATARRSRSCPWSAR